MWQKVLPLAWEPPADGHTGQVTSIALSPDGRWVASASVDTTMILWDIKSRRIIRKWQSHEAVWHIKFSPDSSRLAAGGDDGQLDIWSVEDGNQLATLQGSTHRITSLDWSPDGAKLAYSSDDSITRVWDTKKYVLLHSFKGQSSSVSFSHDGRWLATSGTTCRVWSLDAPKKGGPKQSQPHRQLRTRRGIVRGVAFDYTAPRLATLFDGGDVSIWDLSSGRELKHHAARTPENRNGLHSAKEIPTTTTDRKQTPEPTYIIAFSEEGDQLLWTSKDSKLNVCDLHLDVVRLPFQEDVGSVSSAAFHSEYIISALSDGVLRIWRRDDGSVVNSTALVGDRLEVTQTLLAPGKGIVLQGSRDGKLHLYNFSER